MKGTRLSQPPGSPLIGGRSRTHRPFWSVWALSSAVALLFAVIVMTGSYAFLDDGPPGTTLADHLESAVRLIGGIGWPGAFLFAALAVGLSRLMGWRRQVLVGAVAGTIGAIASSMALIALILSRWQ